MFKKVISVIVVTALAGMTLCSCKKDKDKEIQPVEEVTTPESKAESSEPISESDAFAIYKTALANPAILPPSGDYIITIEKSDDRNTPLEKMIFATKGADYSLAWMVGFNDFEITAKDGKTYAYVLGRISDEDFFSDWSILPDAGRFSKDGCFKFINKNYDLSLKNFDMQTAKYEGQSFVNTNLADEFTVSPKEGTVDSGTEFTLTTLEGNQYNAVKVENSYIVYNNEGAQYFEDGVIIVDGNTYKPSDLEPVKVQQENNIHLFFDRKTQKLIKVVDSSSGNIYSITADGLDSIELPEEIRKGDMVVVEETDDAINDKLFKLGYNTLMTS